METFRLALVGAGRMGRTHLAAITGSSEVSVTGALMAVPTDQHVAVLAQVMAAGLPVLCEKPCGLTSAEAQANADLAERTGLVLQIAYWRRFVPSLMGLRRQL